MREPLFDLNTADSIKHIRLAAETTLAMLDTHMTMMGATRDTGRTTLALAVASWLANGVTVKQAYEEVNTFMEDVDAYLDAIVDEQNTADHG